MPRKKKPVITKDRATIRTIQQFLNEIHKTDVSKPVGYVFAILNEDDLRMQEIDVMTIPSEEHVIKLIKDAFKIKAVYVAFTIWHPSEDEDVHSLTIIVYSKEEKTISKSPFRIVSNKLVPVQKQEKGFHIFMEDEGE